MKQVFNYCPISSTSVLIKLFKIIRDKMVVFLETNKLIAETQPDFV